jgi:hypothetical protein
MLDLSKDTEQTEAQLPQMFNGISLPKWENEMLYKQHFDLLAFENLKCKGSERNEYNVYINENEFKTVEAPTVTLAINASEIAKPFKIINVHCRIKDVIPLADLEYIEKKVETVVETKEETTNAVEAAPVETTEAAPAEVESPPATEEKPQES